MQKTPPTTVYIISRPRTAPTPITMPSAVFNLDLIHTLHALHKRIDALEQATQLHARVHHGVTRFDVYSLLGIDKRIAYLKEVALDASSQAWGKPWATPITQ